MHTQIRSTIHFMRNFIALLLGSALLFVGPQSGDAAQLPTLPQVSIDTTYSPPSGGTTFNVSTNTEFTTALNNAVLGDTIILQAPNTFTGPFTLREKTSGSGWIYIQSSDYASLPAPGTRVTLANAVNMPKITVNGGSGAAITTNARAHHYRFVGIEFKPAAGQFVSSLIAIGNGENSLANLPHDIVFDRCYVHGDPNVGGRRGIAMNGASVAVVDSHISDFKEVGADTQALWTYNSPGPLKIVNNYLEAAGENFMSGGGDPDISNLVPSDIEIKRNHFFKPLGWMILNWQVKNLIEFKNARRVLVEGNIFQNSWAAAQIGSLVNAGPSPEGNGAPWTTVEDLTLRYNKGVNLETGFQINGRDSNSQVMNRVLIEHNVLEVTRPAMVNGSGRIFQIQGGPKNITIRHNTGLITVAGGTTAFTENNPVADQFDFRDNIFSNGSSGFDGSGTGSGTDTLNTYYTNNTFTKNAIIGGGPSSDYPANNFFPANTTAVVFVGFAVGNYRLDALSPFKAGAVNQASDGKDLGADIDAIEAAIGGTGPAPKVAPPTKLRVTN